MSAPWARDGEPDLACALAQVGREALGANRDGRAHITTSRVIVTWNHVEIGIGGEASITAGAMPTVLGQIGFVGAVVVRHGPLRMIERRAVGISSILSAINCTDMPPSGVLATTGNGRGRTTHHRHEWGVGPEISVSLCLHGFFIWAL
jgi:hypothetical protein